MSTKVGLIGAHGKLGRMVRRFARAMDCCVTLSASSHEWKERCAPEVVIDVSHHSALDNVMEYCLRKRIPLVEGVSTLLPQHLEKLRQLSARVAVLYAPNFAYAHYLQQTGMLAIAECLRSSRFPSECTVIERHPSSKRDRPSATARALAAVWRGAAFKEVNDIASIRGGLPVSDHTVVVTLPHETLSIRHSVPDRAAAARGALLAARWMVFREPGFYGMTDVYAQFKKERHEQLCKSAM